MKGNLSEEAMCCCRHNWHQHAFFSDRKPFAKAGAYKHYAPDMTFEVIHTKLEVKIDVSPNAATDPDSMAAPDTKTLSGTCHTRIRAIADTLTEVFFAARDMQVGRSSFAGGAEELAIERSQYGFKVMLPKSFKRGDELEISIDYKVTNPKAGIYFTGPSLFSPNKPVQIWTQGQDEDAQYWYPVAGADFPNHKMTSEVIATVPDKMVALSNGTLVLERHDTDAKTKTFHWSLSKPHVSYLVTLVVGQFARIQDAHGRLEVDCWVHPSKYEAAKIYHRDTAKLVALFERLYRTPYPWEHKYSQVLVQDFIFGGMENTTLSTITDRILADPSTAEEYYRSMVRLNAHELCHQWFGDKVTCRDWSHAWLNEGGATYGEVEAMEFLYGKAERDYYAHNLAKQYFAEDKQYRRPIVTNEYNEPIDLFDRTLYQKGGLVRHMMRYLLGDEGYYRSMETFLKDNAYQPVETIDLLKAVEKATGRNLRAFADQWIYGAGFPEYKVTYLWDESTKIATVKVSQTQKLEGQTGLFSMPVCLSFTLANGEAVEFMPYISEKEHTLQFPLAGKPVMFNFDPGNWILKKLDLSGVPKAMLIYQLHNAPTVMGRVHAANALAEMGGLDAVEALAKACGSTGLHYGAQIEAANALGAIGTPAAGEALKQLASASVPQVRRAVIAALGNFKDDETVALLGKVLAGEEEKSVFVRSDAAVALGKTKKPQAVAYLKEAVNISSWNELIRVGVVNGLAEAGDEAVLDLVRDLAAPEQPSMSRPAAISALGRLAKKAPKAIAILQELAEAGHTEDFSLRMSLIGAMGESKNQDCIPLLQKLGKIIHDGRLKRAVADTMEALQESNNNSTSEVSSLKAELDKTQEQVRSLAERLEKQELEHRSKAS